AAPPARPLARRHQLRPDALDRRRDLQTPSPLITFRDRSSRSPPSSPGASLPSASGGSTMHPHVSRRTAATIAVIVAAPILIATPAIRAREEAPPSSFRVQVVGQG